MRPLLRVLLLLGALASHTALARRADFNREIKTLSDGGATVFYHRIREGADPDDIARTVARGHRHELSPAEEHALYERMLDWVAVLEPPPLHQGPQLFEVALQHPVRVTVPVHYGDNAAQLAAAVLELGAPAASRDGLVELFHARLQAYWRGACLGEAHCVAAACRRHRGVFPGYELAVRPPPVTKRAVLRSMAYRFDLAACVETGTFRGDTTLDLAVVCDRVVTVEMQPELARAAAERFRREAPDRDIAVIEGDSSDVLAAADIMRADEGVLFFLDGHYSQGETARGAADSPIMRELEAVAARGPDRRDVIVIDDIDAFRGDRLFVGFVYPELADVQDRLCELFPGWVFDVEENLGRLYWPVTPA